MRRILYRVLFGGYETLNELDGIELGGVEAILLTDDPNLASRTWDVRLIEPEFPDDPVRSQRILKICGHPQLGEYDESLYLDNSVELRVGPALLLDEWLSDPGVDIALPLHGYRESVADEFTQVLAAGHDEPAVLREQLASYQAHSAAVLAQRPYWTALLARRSGARLDARMRVWADHVLRYSRRDQLSINQALASADIRVNPISMDPFETQWHRWPLDLGRPPGGGRVVGPTSGGLVIEIRRLESKLDDVHADSAAKRRALMARLASVETAAKEAAIASERAASLARDHAAEELTRVVNAAEAAATRSLASEASLVQQLEESVALRVVVEHDRDVAQADANRFRQEIEAIKGSTSWRYTSALRWISRTFRRR